MPRVDRRFISRESTNVHRHNQMNGGGFAAWAVVRDVDLDAVVAEVQRKLSSDEIELVDVGTALFQLGYEVRRRQEEATSDRIREEAEDMVTRYPELGGTASSEVKRREQQRVKADEVLKRAER